jgi:cytochrome P450
MQRSGPLFKEVDEVLQGATRITRMDDALAVLRSTDFRMESPGHAAPLLAGTVRWIDGPDHRARRRILNRLVRREAHERYREQVLIPAMAREIGKVLLTTGPDGLVRVDLIALGRRIFVELGAVLTGITGLEHEETVQDLIQLLARVARTRNPKWLSDPELAVAEGIAVHREFRDGFFLPSLAAKQELVARCIAGELAEDQLPVDLITMIALKADPAWEDEGQQVRDALNYLSGATSTTLHPLGPAIDELETWFEAHPEDVRLSLDPTFMSGAMNEVLRLYPATPIAFRVATAKVTLPSGIEIQNGETVALDKQAANTDESAYGPDALIFDPRREVLTGVYPYGLTFGSGAHMCPGLPVVLGAEGIDGSHVHLLIALYSAGVQRDRSAPALRTDGFKSATYRTYPIVLTGDRPTAA